MPPSNGPFVQGFLRALGNPQLQELVADFYAARDDLVVDDHAAVCADLSAFLVALRELLEDRQALLLSRGEVQPADSLTEGIQGVGVAADLVAAGEEGLCDGAAVLYLFCERAGIGPSVGADVPPALFSQLDEFLVLLGLGGVSVAELWEASRDESPELCRALWEALRRLLTTVRRCCRTR